MFRRIALLAGAVFAMLAISMTPAHATGGAYTSNGHGSVYFDSYGEHLTVNDWNADGDGVRGYLEELRRGPGGQDHYYKEKTLNNTNGLKGAATHSNRNIPNGTTVRYRACLIDSAHDKTPHHCGGWKYDKA